LERKRLREAAFDEIRRIIKEEEPQRPSVRLSTSDTLVKVAEARKTDPAKLSRLMRGELDWVVMKCLEKDRSRRYDTASALARDVERHLKDEPVEARPPSTWYRVRKMARRNRTALTVTGVVAAVALLGTTVSLWQASLARADRERARIAEEERLADLARADEEIRKRDAALVAERRQYALDRAIEAAFGGDLEKARKAIVAAEKAGVAPERVRWLRGLACFNQGKHEEAIQEFQASIDLKPSVAAHTMHFLAVFDASLFSGNSLARYFQLPTEGLNSTAPETAEDYLCRGLTMGRLAGTRRYKEGLFKREQALADIDKAIEMRDTPIARAFRAMVAYEIAPEGEDHAAAAERALAGIRQAKRQLPDNKFLRFMSLGAHIWVADVCEEISQPEKRKAALEEAGRDAEELKGILNYSYVMAGVNYFELIKDKDAALAELKWASSQPETSDLVTNYALALYERGRDAEALSVLDERLKLKPDNTQGQMLRIILLAEQSEIGFDKAYARFRELTDSLKRGVNGPTWSPFETSAFLLLGKKKELAESWVNAAAIMPFDKYVTGTLSEAEMFQLAGKNRLHLCFCHYQVGLDRLSNGDRAGACEHFQKALDTKFYAAVIYPHARAYLARLKRDPEWPRWIPVTK
jgi:tetratricopeptide (TPR) repeat protein